MIDLHIHTTYSDGSFSPDEIINLALESNLKAIAITDHDTIEGLYNISDTKGLEVINGIEFSADYNGLEIHILGYFININNIRFLSFLKDLEKTRLERNAKLINKLNKIGLDISNEFVNSLAEKNLVTKAHFAKALVQKKYCKNLKEAFSIYLGKGKPAYIPRDLTPYNKAINIIKMAEGISVLAHPLLYKLSNKDLEKMIVQLKTQGLGAIECYYPSNTKSQTNFLVSLCNKYNLAKTGGSDFHGLNRPDVSVGSIYLGDKISYKILEELKNWRNYER